MKQRIKILLSCLLFCGVLWSSGMVASLANRIEPTMSVSVQEGLALPVIMYHQVLKDESRTGQYTITPTMLEEDLQTIQSLGYQTVTVAEVLDYIAGRGTLPEHPILLTFDDGYATFYEYVYSLLQQYDQSAVVSIVGKYTDLYSYNGDANLSYTHLTWDQLDEMAQSGRVEIANHSYDLHSYDDSRYGVLQNEGESDDDYIALLTGDLTTLNDEIYENLGIYCNIFCYPFGMRDTLSDQTVSTLGFSVILGCQEQVNWITVGQETPLILDRFNRTSDQTVADILATIA